MNSDQPIVVTLDGSELAEAALPYAAAVAKATGAPLLLATVWDGGEEIFRGELRDLAADIAALGEEHFDRYLADAAARVAKDGIEAGASVRHGKPADEILALLEERNAGMLVMSTHGRSGLGRWWYGSVAGRLVREATVPTMVVGTEQLRESNGSAPIARILVPLDGSALSEAALAPAVELSKAFGAEILLAQVVTWSSQTFVFGVPDIDVAQVGSKLTAASESYLAEKAQTLGTDRLVETVVVHGQPADRLIDLVKARDIDLVVMASHARGGVARAALGSVADRMLQSASPVLFVRPEA